MRVRREIHPRSIRWSSEVFQVCKIIKKIYLTVLRHERHAKELLTSLSRAKVSSTRVGAAYSKTVVTDKYN